MGVGYNEAISGTPVQIIDQDLELIELEELYDSKRINRELNNG